MAHPKLDVPLRFARLTEPMEMASDGFKYRLCAAPPYPADHPK